MKKSNRKARVRGATLRSILLLGASFLVAPLAHAQDEDGAEAGEDEIVVVGTQIRGAQLTDVLPVTVLGEDEIDAVAPTSGDELFRSIPQAGDVTFNESRLTGGINDARGDTASINLRGIGTGNTLMLLNGRRMVLHPGIQVENLVPVATVNTNSIPTAGVRRVEVLRDGASAIYGTDAVAGVINTVLRDNFEGLRIEFEGSRAADSAMDQLDLSIEAGRDFNDGRTNISFFGNFTNRDPLLAAEREFSRDSDARHLLDPTNPYRDFFRNNSTDTPWPEFIRLVSSVGNPYGVSTAGLTYNGTTITSTSSTTGGATFHIQPLTNSGCNGGEISPGSGTCFDNNILSTTTSDENLRYNSNDERTLWGEVDRSNAFFFANHDFGNGIELFAEIGGYASQLVSYRDQEVPLSTQRVIVPSTNYWNPFGPAGSINRNANTNAPAGGLNLELNDYRPVDAGAVRIEVDQYVYRALTGLRGNWNTWDWEGALLYSSAESNDTMRQPSMTLFQEALSRTTPDAYNPFSGADPNDPSNGDTSRNPQSVIDSFMVDVSRISATSMAMADFRVSRPDLFQVWGGNAGVAAGLEFRHETYEDDRDRRLDGTITYTALDGSGGANVSDVMGASPTPDTEGDRNVFSAFAELALPLISPEMNIPFVQSLEAQLAVRYENYTEFGDITRPKVAMAWRLADWLMFRSSWSQGFRAPNLPQQYERGILRSNTRSDWIRCEARTQLDVLDPNYLPAFGSTGSGTPTCSSTEGISVQSNRSGSETLEPETSENFTAGLVFEPSFIPRRFGQFIITADYWSVEQEGVIGLLGDSNAITYDYLLRMQGEAGNPNVIRAAPTAADDAIFLGALDFDGNPLAAVGEITQVIDNYRNLGPREIEGYDISINYDIDDTPLGDWSVRLNMARLLTFFQSPGPEQQAMLDAQAAGIIDAFPSIPGAESLVEQNGLPKLRLSSTITWRGGDWGAGLYSSYVGGVDDTSARLDTSLGGAAWRVKPWLTHNLYVQYEIDGTQLIDDVRLRLGARNLFDETPPLADSDTGYLGELHSPRGRTVYFSIRTRF
jgi:outer membrane receptor protein involved in Fe transport